MATHTRTWILAGLLGLVTACGGGGGGDRAPGVESGPPPSGGAVTPPTPEIPAPNPAPYEEAERLFAFITDAQIDDEGRAVVDFQLTDGNNTAIIDLEQSNVRFVLSKLQSSPLGNLTGSWLSYVNRIEQPGVGPGTEAKLQATYERDGEFTNNEDGSYRYRFITSVNDLTQDVLDQAAAEGLDLSYEPDRTHRVAIQFDGAQDTANPFRDWVPATGATEGIFQMQIAATENCNLCHDKLGIHGGNRTDVEYCVTCHNPGSTDANSGNTVDMKVMIHKIHMGANLPSVMAGGEYAIYGFRDSKHDYSNLHYPQDIRRCVNCHAGSATGEGRDDLVLTAQGDNWAEYSSRAVCGSCHEDLDFDRHAGGQPDDSGCAGCHSANGFAGSIADSHRMLDQEAREAFAASILDVSNSMPGEAPVITFKVSNPLTGEDYDLMNDPVWTGGGSSLNVKMAWNTGDYTNTGNYVLDENGEPTADNASSVSISALSNATDNGDGSYSVTMPLAVPDGSLEPGIAATGSGVATIEGHPVVDYNGDGMAQSVPVGDVHSFFSIDEPDGQPVPRRQSVELQSCLACHGTLVLHGNNRADNIDSCVTCHNPRNTDRGVRAIAANPPTDGKSEESIDFKSMVHGIHAAAMRENPLQVVGFRGFTTYVYDTDAVHYPGNLGNCTACHTEDGFQLPLASTVLGTSVDTGDDVNDPTDDLVTTPATAVCASCHDDSVARAHMTNNGGDFATTQAAIDDEEVVESCSVCHGAGKAADVAEVHPVR